MGKSAGPSLQSAIGSTILCTVQGWVFCFGRMVKKRPKHPLDELLSPKGLQKWVLRLILGLVEVSVGFLQADVCAGLHPMHAKVCISSHAYACMEVCIHSSACRGDKQRTPGRRGAGQCTWDDDPGPLVAVSTPGLPMWPGDAHAHALTGDMDEKCRPFSPSSIQKPGKQNDTGYGPRITA